MNMKKAVLTAGLCLTAIVVAFAAERLKTCVNSGLTGNGCGHTVRAYPPLPNR